MDIFTSGCALVPQSTPSFVEHVTIVILENPRYNGEMAWNFKISTEFLSSLEKCILDL